MLTVCAQIHVHTHAYAYAHTSTYTYANAYARAHILCNCALCKRPTQSVSFGPFRRNKKDIVCVTPPSQSGSGPASIKLHIDKAEVTSTETRYLYTDDPTITNIEPNWSIVK